MRARALLYTQGEGGVWEPVPFKLFKDKFNPDTYERKPFKSFSVALGVETNDITLQIEGISIFALAFSDGNVWDTNHEWRIGFGDGWSETMYNKLYNEKKK